VQSPSSRRIVFTLVPQGWSFFTRNPREAQAVIYEIKDGVPLPLDHKHSSIYNFIGLSRRASVIMSEMQVVKAELPDSIYMTTKWSYQENIVGEYPQQPFKVKNKISNPLLCGEYLLIFQKAVPWAWSKSMKSITMPAKVARVKIECND
jgi:antimicrobial peptide system SdpA family protein